jgi:crooked neck
MAALRPLLRGPQRLVRPPTAWSVERTGVRTFSGGGGGYRAVDLLYEGQDYARQVEKKFSALSGKLPWEPDPKHLAGVKRRWQAPEPTLNELVREDVPLARNLFRNVLQQHYAQDMGMWNKWAVMEWKAGNYELARMIFAKAGKTSFHAELWQSWASMELEAKNLREAKRLFQVILATDPANAKAGLGMALYEAEAGRAAAARKRFQALVRRHPDDVLVLQAHAVFEAKHQHLALARSLFQAAAEHPNASAQVWHAWAKAEFDAGLFRNTVAVVTRGMRHFPTHKWLVLLGAMANFKLGDLYEARRGYRRLIDGGLYVEASAYNAYAQMEQELGNDDVALALYIEALNQFPDHVPSAMSLAIMYAKRGKMDQARSVFERVMGHVHYTGSVLQSWGAFEEQYGKLENARELYKEATKQQPTHVDSWRALARVEARLGHAEAARAVLTMASQHIPSDAPLLVELGKIEQRQRNFAAARSAFERALEIDGLSSAVWNLRALLELPLDPERAKTVVESALNAVPKYEKRSRSILLCTYGRAFAALRDYDGAVSAFQRSFKLQPKNWETHVIYAESVLVPNEAWSEAKKHLEAARKLLPRSDHRRRAKVERKLEDLERRMEDAGGADNQAEDAEAEDVDAESDLDEDTDGEEEEAIDRRQAAR